MAGDDQRVDGDSVGVPFDRVFATRPAWPSCAAIAAPSACTASVRRRRSGTSSGDITSVCRWTRPPFDTAQ